MKKIQMHQVSNINISILSDEVVKTNILQANNVSNNYDNPIIDNGNLYTKNRMTSIKINILSYRRREK